jgi:DNA-binding response OmpR family regulator
MQCRLVRRALVRAGLSGRDSLAPGRRSLLAGGPQGLGLGHETPGSEQTLELARREQPDLITTDILNIHMPGIDLVFQLRNEATTRDTPILLASAHARHWLGFFGGADAFLQLPFGPQELLALVDELLWTR